MFHLQQLTQITDKLQNKRRTLVCEQVFGDPDLAEKQHKFPRDVSGGGFPQGHYLGVSSDVVQDH